MSPAMLIVGRAGAGKTPRRHSLLISTCPSVASPGLGVLPGCPAIPCHQKPFPVSIQKGNAYAPCPLTVPGVSCRKKINVPAQLPSPVYSKVVVDAASLCRMHNSCASLHRKVSVVLGAATIPARTAVMRSSAPAVSTSSPMPHRAAVENKQTRW